MTTLEIDGIYSQTDALSRHTIMRQCKTCKRWTKMNIEEFRNCSSCNAINYDLQSTKSLRTFNFDTDSRRKPK